jgi:hypothetical protein
MPRFGCCARFWPMRMPQQCLPCSGDEAEAWAKYDEVIRAEWDSIMDPNDDGPYPGDPDAAQDRIRQAHGAEWSRWELTQHEIEIPAAR